jgi:hypothetical protein
LGIDPGNQNQDHQECSTHAVHNTSEAIACFHVFDALAILNFAVDSYAIERKPNGGVFRAVIMFGAILQRTMHVGRFEDNLFG